MSPIILQAIASGLVTGCVYALVSLSLVIVYKSVDLLNFGGGELVMVGGYLALLVVVRFGFGYLMIFPVVIAVGFAIGALLDQNPIELDPAGPCAGYGDRTDDRRHPRSFLFVEGRRARHSVYRGASTARTALAR